MADNWLEKKFEDFYSGKTKEDRAREAAWKRRMAAYKKKLAEQKAAEQAECDAAGKPEA